MAKKIMIIMAIVVVVLVNNVKAKEVIIPDNAIRIRIIANSNSFKDQFIKGQVRDSRQLQINEMLANVKTIEEARSILNKNLKKFDFVVEKVLKRNNVDLNYNINYGMNYFPEKEFKGVNYNEGYYESIVVTLGKGKGNNWWCVLFPPLCLMESEEKDMDDIEYKSFIKEKIDAFFKN